MSAHVINWGHLEPYREEYKGLQAEVRETDTRKRLKAAALDMMDQCTNIHDAERVLDLFHDLADALERAELEAGESE